MDRFKNWAHFGMDLLIIARARAIATTTAFLARSLGHGSRRRRRGARAPGQGRHPAARPERGHIKNRIALLLRFWFERVQKLKVFPERSRSPQSLEELASRFPVWGGQFALKCHRILYRVAL